MVEAQLHTWYALYSAVCVCVFLYFLLLSLSVYFSFFQCSYLYFWNPILFFYTNQPSIHTKRYVRYVWDIFWTNFTSLLLGSLLLCYFVENSESAGRKTALKCGFFWAPSTRIRRKKCGFKNVQIRVDMAFRPCLQGGRVTLVLGGLP